MISIYFILIIKKFIDSSIKKIHFFTLKKKKEEL